MTKPFFIILISILAFGSFSNCKKNEGIQEEEKELCIYKNTENVLEVKSPSTGIVHQSINIEVVFGVNNGCGQFNKFIETENGNTKTIEIEAKYVGCACTLDTPIRMTNYQFTPHQTGNYELKFKSSPTEFIVLNLTVNE